MNEEEQTEALRRAVEVECPEAKEMLRLAYGAGPEPGCYLPLVAYAETLDVHEARASCILLAMMAATALDMDPLQ